MMKSRSIFFSAVLMAASLFTSCTEFVNKIAESMAMETLNFEYEDSAKWGKVVEQELSLPAFTGVKTHGKVCIVLSQDSVCSVRVRANEKCIEAYKYEVKNGELRIDHKNFKGNVNKNTPGVTFFITVPSLKEVECSGASELRVPGTMEQADPMEVEMSGAGRISIDSLSVKSLSMEMNGAAECSFAKVTAQGDIEIEVNGAGNLNANVFCQDLEVEINGAGNAVLSGKCENFSCQQNGAAKIDTSNLNK